ncbi:acetylornithine transaminase protein [Paraburkholderia hospita]|uniref:Acetylornithine aminotransferase n=1 Tax=Paraburkholderia hospita TaxID=169430 RepID=A0ABN0F3F9_9BURK|nr:aspartate aminotransferase family protein [Paraburkholderia hospita]EIM93111.1 acetylornithine transaminase protein [Paraburkholderia hospita]OUL90130.1 acetylornithine transaminase [Paraburkholderia hospita]
MRSSASSFLFPVYSRAPLCFERGIGCSLFTPDGDLYLDFSSGVAVNALGHAHPRLVDALQRQAEKLWHVSNLYIVPEQELLARRLCELSFADRVFFCNSGTEAVELSIKAARRYHYYNGDESRNRIITLEGAFHGRTLGALAATGQEEYLEGFEPRIGGFDQVPFGDLHALESVISERTAGVLIEPVQGEGGVRTMPAGYLRSVRKLCDRYGILLLLDEVQTGIGRTGRFFGYEETGAIPDILAAAKGLGGGFPIGACLATEAVGVAMQSGTHGSTFGGNPLAMAVADEVVDIISAPGFLERVRAASSRLRIEVELLVSMYPRVFDRVSGTGLLIGLRCVPPVHRVIETLHEHKLLCVPAGNNVLRLLPPLTISDAEIDEAVLRLSRAARSLSAVTSM